LVIFLHCAEAGFALRMGDKQKRIKIDKNGGITGVVSIRISNAMQETRWICENKNWELYEKFHKNSLLEIFY
jgi:hypothetical protein